MRLRLVFHYQLHAVTGFPLGILLCSEAPSTMACARLIQPVGSNGRRRTSQRRRTAPRRSSPAPLPRAQLRVGRALAPLARRRTGLHASRSQPPAALARPIPCCRRGGCQVPVLLPVCAGDLRPSGLSGAAHRGWSGGLSGPALLSLASSSLPLQQGSSPALRGVAAASFETAWLCTRVCELVPLARP